MEDSGEKISGPKVMETLHSIIASKQFCKLEIPKTGYCWITLLSGVIKEGHSSYLLIGEKGGIQLLSGPPPLCHRILRNKGNSEKDIGPTYL